MFLLTAIVTLLHPATHCTDPLNSQHEADRQERCMVRFERDAGMSDLFREAMDIGPEATDLSDCLLSQAVQTAVVVALASTTSWLYAYPCA